MPSGEALKTYRRKILEGETYELIKHNDIKSIF
jgi:hypothetical protein